MAGHLLLGVSWMAGHLLLGVSWMAGHLLLVCPGWLVIFYWVCPDGWSSPIGHAILRHEISKDPPLAFGGLWSVPVSSG